MSCPVSDSPKLHWSPFILNHKFSFKGLVTKKEWTRCNHRYRKGLTRVQLGSAPDEFAGLNTPVTITTLHRYASSIMGTKKVNPEKWPLEYQPDTREFDPDPLIEAELDLPDDMDVD